MEDDKFLTLLNKIGEIAERTARMDTRQEGMYKDMESIKDEDRRQNQLLSEHIQGTVTNRQRLEIEIQNRISLETSQKDLQSRVEKLELNPKFQAWIKDNIVLLCTIATAVGAILLLFVKHA